MFYTPEILCMRKNGKLARVWLAATLNERLFKQAVGNKALLAVSIDNACANILRILNSGGQRFRFSLYLSSQLMYGTVKLFSYQVKIYETSLLRIEQVLMPGAFEKRGKGKKPSYDNDVMIEIDLPEVPPLEELFKDFHLRNDIHLLPEADYETISASVARLHVDSPTFGELTDAELRIFLEEDFAQLQPGENLDDFNEPIRHVADDTNQRPVSPPLPIEQQDLGRTGGDSSAADLRDKILKTPKKREATAMTNLDTPTKRRRRNLQSELDATDEQRANGQSAIQTADFPTDQPIDRPAGFPTDQPIDQPADFPADQPIDRPADFPTDQPIDLPVDLPANVPIDDAIPSANRPEDNNLHLESVELETVVRRRNKRTRVFADVHTKLPQVELARQIENVNAHTVPYETTLAVPARRRPVSASTLLAMPSTIFQTTSEDWLRVGSRHVKWTTTLRYAFVDRTIGPFTVDDDNSMDVEAIRAVDSRPQLMPDEVSSVLGRGLEEASSRSKTTDEPSSRHPINQPVMPEIAGDNYQPPTTDGVDLNEITDEPIFENTSDAATVSVTNPQVSVTNVARTESTVTLTSDPETGDIDAFLPPKLREKNLLKKTSHEKSSSGEAVVDVPPSPTTSLRSEGSLPILPSKSDLMAMIKRCWERNQGGRLYFSHLIPPESKTRLEAAHCFSLLLEFHKEDKVDLEQDEMYGELYICQPN